MATRTEVQASNELFFALLENPATTKQAADTLNQFTRTTLRERGFWRKQMSPQTITNADLHPQLGTDDPVRIEEREPDSPPAVSVGFAQLPNNFYIQGTKYPVTFGRVLTARATKDVEQLRSWTMDIRQVISDNELKDLEAEEDTQWIAALNAAMIAVNTNVPWSGRPQWVTINGGMSRNSIVESKKIMPRTAARLSPTQGLINNVSVMEFMKYDRNEMGGDLSEKVLRDGFGEGHFAGIDWLVTIKQELVPEDSVFYLADQMYIGKAYLLEDATIFVKSEAFFIEWFMYECLGSTIGNTGGLARADFV